jgi:transcriptional regulator with XRE-family HTH domain
MENTGSIGSRIREVRNNLNLSQEELAASLDVSRSVLSQIEIDKIRPSVDLITRLVKRYRVDYKWLMEGKKHPGQQDAGMDNLLMKESRSDDMSFDKAFASELFSISAPGEPRANIADQYLSSFASGEFHNRDREMPLISGSAISEYPAIMEDKAALNRLSWIRLPAEPNKFYRAFAIPDMRLSPFLEKGDILVAYKVEPELLAPMSYYIFVTDRKVVFGILHDILPGKTVTINENPLMQKPVDYPALDIREFWLVDKLISDNFISRFRYVQMVLQSMGMGPQK